MGLLRRQPLQIASILVLAAAVVEAWVAWRYIKVQHQGERVPRLERELALKTAELNQLIFKRDYENRRRAQPSKVAQSASPVLTADEELAQAAAQRPGFISARDERPLGASRPSAAMGASSVGFLPGFPVPTDDDLGEDQADHLGTPQGAAPESKFELTQVDIDAKHLVSMVNIMTGKKSAELVKFKNQTAIHYLSFAAADEHPIWQVVDAVRKARALGEISLVADSKADLAKLESTREQLLDLGVPSRLIHQRAGEPAYQGLEGMLITLQGERK